MSPKELMIIFCSKPPREQKKWRKTLHKTLEEFLKTAVKQDLKILNCWMNNPDFYPGLFLSAEVLLILSAYGKSFYNRPTF